MPTLNRRLQILIDDGRFERVERQAAAEDISVGAFVRRLIDGALDAAGLRNRQLAFVDTLLAAPRMDFGAATELKELIEESHISPALRD